MTLTIDDMMLAAPVIPVLVIDDVDRGVAVATALIREGSTSVR